MLLHVATNRICESPAMASTVFCAARIFSPEEPTIPDCIAAKLKLTIGVLNSLVIASVRKRLESVLAVVYLIFNEGYTATFGEEWMREELCNEALRLGRMPRGTSSR